MPLSNDERGWVMTGLSGVACIFGAAFICVDILVRQFPGQRNFRIQDSDAFLSTSLSLSFGVMLFSALYNMLPSSKRSLEDGGFSPKEAAWIMIACFIGGVAGIQILSNALHRFVPHDIVDCEHSHDDEEAPKEGGHHHQENGHASPGGHDHSHDNASAKIRKPNTRQRSTLPGHVPMAAKAPKATSYFALPDDNHFAPTAETEELQNESEMSEAAPGQALRTRPSFYKRITTGISNLVPGKNVACDGCDGPCYGFGDVCNSDCFRSINTRRATSIHNVATETTPLLQPAGKEAQAPRPNTRAAPEGIADREARDDETVDGSSTTKQVAEHNPPHLHSAGHSHSHDHDHDHHDDDDDSSSTADLQQSHHHHVPKNAFLSIGLQTSIAIALHKLPEGFITYATNHANPKLGVSVFLALFIHNITEGFALALPLYLAINSRMKAMLISFVLGGLSQPLGAGVAALWFKLAGTSNWAPSESIYGGMFAVTAGIMASVALQLFSESLDLTHSKTLCMVGAFSGMLILGISGALTA